MKKDKKMTKTQESKPDTGRAVGDLVREIEKLSGEDKQKFCQTLTESEKRAYINYITERDSEKIECLFRCNEPVGGSVTLTYRAFKGDPETQTFIDGQTYTIPLYLAKRMNNEYQGSGTWYPTHGFIMDAQGKPIIHTAKKNHRFGFMSTNLV